MAELLLIAKDDPAKQPTFEDEDVLAATNWGAIRREHTSRHDAAHRNGDGLIAVWRAMPS